MPYLSLQEQVPIHAPCMVNANCHMSQTFVPEVDTEIPSVGQTRRQPTSTPFP